MGIISVKVLFHTDNFGAGKARESPLTVPEFWLWNTLTLSWQAEDVIWPIVKALWKKLPSLAHLSKLADCNLCLALNIQRQPRSGFGTRTSTVIVSQLHNSCEVSGTSSIHWTYKHSQAIANLYHRVLHLCARLNPFAALLTSYLVMRKLVAVCPYDEYTRHKYHSSVAHRIAEILLLVGT